MRKNDKTDKHPSAFPSTTSSTFLASSEEHLDQHKVLRTDSPFVSAVFRFPQGSLELTSSPVPSSYPSGTHSSPKSEPNTLRLKPRPSFATLRTKSLSCPFLALRPVSRGLTVSRLALLPQRLSHLFPATSASAPNSCGARSTSASPPQFSPGPVYP
jgi:hypothetical protein